MAKTKKKHDPKIEALKQACAPMMHYLAMRDAKPLKGLHDVINAIHTGSEWEAELSLQDLRNLRTALDSLTK